MKDCTMKKTMILAAFAALVSLASCQKEDNIINGTDNQTSPVFTASIAGSTKTTVNLTDGKVAWEESDEITVTDASSASAVYAIESIDKTTGEATFVIKSSETALGDGPYTATYGTAPATAQTYSATAGKLYMTAESSTNSFTFTVQCGLMKLNLTKTDVSVKSIAVTGTPTDGTETTYTLTCTEAQSIATAKDFFIALPDGNYKKIEITNASDNKCTLNSASGVKVEVNHIKPVTFGASKINFTTGTAKATINGVETDVKWIQLWKDGPKFAEYNVSGKKKFSVATKTGAEYVWGANWKTPSKDELNELLLAASETGSEKVSCIYGQVNGELGFTFRGVGDYAGNSVFFPIVSGSDCDETFGYVDYGSSTPDGSKGFFLRLSYDWSGLYSEWLSGASTVTKLIRPVLNE